jgi:hypothetical protein
MDKGQRAQREDSKGERYVRSIRFPKRLAKEIRRRMVEDDAPDFQTELFWLCSGIVPPLYGFTKENIEKNEVTD